VPRSSRLARITAAAVRPTAAIIATTVMWADRSIEVLMTRSPRSPPRRGGPRRAGPSRRRSRIRCAPSGSSQPSWRGAPWTAWRASGRKSVVRVCRFISGLAAASSPTPGWGARSAAGSTAASSRARGSVCWACARPTRCASRLDMATPSKRVVPLEACLVVCSCLACGTCEMTASCPPGAARRFAAGYRCHRGWAWFQGDSNMATSGLAGGVGLL
jgi:hypothetical protein